MRKAAITLQIVGVLVCALGGIGASIVFTHMIDHWRATADPSLHTMSHFVNSGLELAAVGLVVEGFGAFLLVYGSRMHRRAKSAGAQQQ